MRYYYETGGYERFKEAQRTYVRSNLKRRLWFHFSMWGMLLVGIIVALICVTISPFHSSGNAILFSICLGLTTGGIITPLLRPLQLHRMHSIFNSNKSGRAYIEVESPVLVAGIEGRTESRLQRKAICNIIEGDDLILLFTAKKRFIYFSKESLPPEAINELRAWLSLPGAPSEC